MVYVRAFLLLVIFPAFHNATRRQGVCDYFGRRYITCCLDYHLVGGSCEACPVGYIGFNCTRSCPYPLYGQFCFKECHCSQSECDHIKGCKKYGPARSRKPMTSISSPNKNLTGPARSRKPINSKSYPIKTLTGPTRSRTPMSSKSSPSNVTDHRITVPIKTKYNPSITNHCTEFNSTTIIMIIGGIVILLLILIIIFQIYERNCKNRERKRPAVCVQSRPYEDNTEPVPCYINDFYGRMEANNLQASGTTEDI
nr:uncharacterized protein LOC117681180 isoform X2 [Crassostrea gigas]